MKDRFKFRAWDSIAKEYIFDSYALYELFVNDFVNDIDNSYQVEQCTGLKDKNGKLIYEGDILKSAYTEKTYIVGREKHYACWSYRYKNVGTTLSEGDIVNYGLEVIGNIHENPELLEEDK